MHPPPGARAGQARAVPISALVSCGPRTGDLKRTSYRSYFKSKFASCSRWEHPTGGGSLDWKSPMLKATIIACAICAGAGGTMLWV